MIDMNTFLTLAAGNPGAISVLGRLVRAGDEVTLDWMQENGVNGPAIWLAYKDFGDETILTLRENVRDDPEGLLTKLRDMGYVS